MDAKELMAGNYLYEVNSPYSNVDKKHRQIIICDDKTFSSVRSFPEAFEGILLTKEWLDKLDFFWEGTRFTKRNPAKNGWNMAIYEIDGGFRWQADMFYHVKIKYVHQLQNLYFSLTGEYLKIIS